MSQRAKPGRCINLGAAASAIREHVNVKQQATEPTNSFYPICCILYTQRNVCLFVAWLRFCLVWFYKGLKTNSHFSSLKK